MYSNSNEKKRNIPAGTTNPGDINLFDRVQSVNNSRGA